MNSTHKSGGWKKTLLTVLCVVLALILAIMVAVTIYAESLFGRIDRVDDNDETLSSDELNQFLNATDAPEEGATGPELNEDDMSMPEDPVETIGNSQNLINILLVGQDRRGSSGRMHSDAMILCTVNKSTKTITLTSFMRDMWVKIPGYFNERLNVSYMLGKNGFETLNNTLEYNFGVQIDHNVEVDFSGFAKIVDLVGGVDLELSKAEANYLNNRGNWDTNEEYDGSWKLKEGVNHMTGEQALAYSRIRNVGGSQGGGDFGRTGRQRIVLTKLLEKAKSLSLAQLNELINGIVPLIRTDMSNADMTGYIIELFPLLMDLNIQTARVPTEGTWSYARINGKSVIKVDFKENQKYLKDTIGE